METKITELPFKVDPTRKYIFRVAKINNQSGASIKRQLTPNSVSIPSTDTIYLKDEELGITVPHEIRYSSGQKTIFVDEQPENTRHEFIDIDKKGFIELNPKTEASKILYLLNCNYRADNEYRNQDNKPIFIWVRQEEAKNNAIKTKRRHTEASNKIFAMSTSELRDYASAIGIKYKGLSSDDLQYELLAYSERNLETFFENLESPLFKTIILTNKAFEKGIIKLTNGIVTLVSAQRILVSVPSGVDAVSETAHYFLSTKGKDDWNYVFKSLEASLESEKQLTSGYEGNTSKSAKVNSKGLKADTVLEMTITELIDNSIKADVIRWSAPYYYLGDRQLGKGKKETYQIIEEDESLKRLTQSLLVTKLTDQE